MEGLRARAWACGLFPRRWVRYPPGSPPPGPPVAMAPPWAGAWSLSPAAQLHSELARRVDAAAGLSEAPAGQQGAVWGPAAAAAGAAAAGERGAQAAAAGGAPEAHRGAERAAPAAGGGEDPLGRLCNPPLVAAAPFLGVRRGPGSRPWGRGHSLLGAHTAELQRRLQPGALTGGGLPLLGVVWPWRGHIRKAGEGCSPFRSCSGITFLVRLPWPPHLKSQPLSTSCPVALPCLIVFI